MPKNLFEWFKKNISNLNNFLYFSRNNSNIKNFEKSLVSVNKIILSKTGLEKGITFEYYEKYFENLKSFGLQKDFEVITTNDKILLRGSILTSPVKNQNNDKIIIFCHGVTSNRWSLFYSIHLVIKLGYRVLLYDARNHGFSEKSYTTLGKIESLDLEDIVKWTIKNYKPKKIGFYGFSMGSATLLFWISYFQNSHPEVAFAICDSPFDNFEKRFLEFLNIDKLDVKKIFQSWKRYVFHSIVRRIIESPVDTSEINPILTLPKRLKVKLLLLHGLADTVIPWISSLRIWQKINRNSINRNMVSLYFFDDADHGELSFFGDYLPINIYRMVKRKRKKSSGLSFSSIIYKFLADNFF